MSSSSNDAPLGFVDRFRVESRLGRGGMGDVYKAYDTVLERTVAVKTLTPENAGPQGVDRLLREARACARLTHPGIVTIHDVLQVEGRVYIVMEHLQGSSLESLPRFPRFSSLEAKLDIIIRILDALHYAHGRGVVHRDIKPTNVQLLPDGSVKLLDFGIAHIAGAAALTVTGTMTGTAHYASPEQLRGEESDASTDIYSTGILAYEVLTRRRPFDGDSVAAVLKKVLHDPLPAMGTWLSETFPEAESIVRRATAKRSSDRYANAEDMKNALAAFAASSREAIVARQAEVAATSERLIIEAKSLIANDRTAEAIPLLTSVLRSNPDAEEARRLLQASDGTAGVAAGPATATAGAAGVAAGPPAAPEADTASTFLTGADEPTTISPPAPAMAAGAAADCPQPAAPSPWWSRRLAIAAAPVLVLLTGVILLGPSWMPQGSAPAASSPLEPRSELVAETPGPAAAERSPAASEEGPAAAERSPAASEEESRARGSGTSETPSAESTGTATRRRENAGGDGRESTTGAAGTSASPTAVPTALPAGAPAAPPVLSAVAPAPPVPPAGAKNLYYATTPPGPASWAGGKMPPAPVAAANSAANAGLKYRILRREPGGEAVEVDADTLFRSGDRIRFGFEPNVDGYLYVIQRGSTGRWSVLLPHPMIDGGRNDVTPFGEVTVPPEGWFQFDENPGAEQVFVYLSREPIDTLPWGGGAVVSAQSVDEPTVIELANSVRSRDLVFEKDDAPGDADRAAYVVNQDDAGGAVAWTVELSHR